MKHWEIIADNLKKRGIPGAFDAIIDSPQGLQVSIVEALPLLLGVGQVKTGAWPNMVDLPF